MGKVKHSKDAEFYLGQIRQLKSENRNLRKRIRQLEKMEHMFEENQGSDPEDEEQQENIKEAKIMCPRCNKGYLEIKNVIDIQFEQCSRSGCFYSKRVKK